MSVWRKYVDIVIYGPYTFKYQHTLLIRYFNTPDIRILFHTFLWLVTKCELLGLVLPQRSDAVASLLANGSSVFKWKLCCHRQGLWQHRIVTVTHGPTGCNTMAILMISDDVLVSGASIAITITLNPMGCGSISLCLVESPLIHSLHTLIGGNFQPYILGLFLDQRQDTLCERKARGGGGGGQNRFRQWIGRVASIYSNADTISH